MPRPSDRPDSLHCPSWLQWLTSVVILFHFTAIFFAVTGASSGSFEPPPLSYDGLQVLRPYLHPLKLGSSFRFYAPDPNVVSTLWIRIQFEDGNTTCIEWPHFRDRGNGSTFIRNYSVNGQLNVQPRPGDPGSVVLTPASARLVSSYATRIARHVVPDTFRSSQVALKHLDLYLVSRYQPLPAQVKAGVDPQSVWLCSGHILGRYLADGTRLSGEVALPLQIHDLVATVIEDDLLSEDDPPWLSGADAIRYRQRTPTVIDRLLKESPDLASRSGEELRRRLAEHSTALQARMVDSSMSPAEPPAREIQP